MLLGATNNGLKWYQCVHHIVNLTHCNKDHMSRLNGVSSEYITTYSDIHLIIKNHVW